MRPFKSALRSRRPSEESWHFGIEGMDGIDRRLDGLNVRCCLVSDEALDDFVEGSNHGVQVHPGQQDIHFDAAQGVWTNLSANAVCF